MLLVCPAARFSGDGKEFSRALVWKMISCSDRYSIRIRYSYSHCNIRQNNWQRH